MLLKILIGGIIILIVILFIFKTNIDFHDWFLGESDNNEQI
jgi:hypothetical protein